MQGISFLVNILTQKQIFTINTNGFSKEAMAWKQMAKHTYTEK